MPFTSLSPLLSNPSSPLFSVMPTVQPQSLSSLCSWWESTHAKNAPLPNICEDMLNKIEDGSSLFVFILSDCPSPWDGLSNSTQVVLTYQAVTDTAKRDFPPDYRLQKILLLIQRLSKKGDNAMYSKDVRTEVEVYNESLKSPPNHMDGETFSIVKQNEIEREKRQFL